MVRMSVGVVRKRLFAGWAPRAVLRAKGADTWCGSAGGGRARKRRLAQRRIRIARSCGGPRRVRRRRRPPEGACRGRYFYFPRTKTRLRARCAPLRARYGSGARNHSFRAPERLPRRAHVPQAGFRATARDLRPARRSAGRCRGVGFCVPAVPRASARPTLFARVRARSFRVRIWRRRRAGGAARPSAGLSIPLDVRCAFRPIHTAWARSALFARSVLF